MSAGKVKKEPPPATALMKPAAKAARVGNIENRDRNPAIL
jgi:hypothetical protein